MVDLRRMMIELRRPWPHALVGSVCLVLGMAMDDPLLVLMGSWGVVIALITITDPSP